MKVRFGGLLFNGDEGAATYTVEADGIKGWLKGGVGVRRESVSRPNAHGDFDTPSFRTGRRVTLQGLILTDSPTKQDHAILQLTGMLASGQKGRFFVDNALGTTWADMRLIDVQVSRRVYGRVADYRIELWGANPRIFGESRTFAAGEPAYHYGNFDAIPELTVTGVYASGYTVSASGKSYVVTQALASGQTHRIDLRSGWLYRNNVLQSGAVSAAGSWTVPPGQRVTHSLTGSGVLKVTVVDTYM